MQFPIKYSLLSFVLFTSSAAAFRKIITAHSRFQEFVTTEMLQRVQTFPFITTLTDSQPTYYRMRSIICGPQGFDFIKMVIRPKVVKSSCDADLATVRRIAIRRLIRQGADNEWIIRPRASGPSNGSPKGSQME